MRLIIHIGCALERMVINNGLKFNEKNIENIDKEKLKELGGSAWIRDQIRKAYNESKASEE